MKQLYHALFKHLSAIVLRMSKQLKTHPIETRLPTSSVWVAFEPSVQVAGGIIPPWEPPAQQSNLFFVVRVLSGTFATQEGIKMFKPDIHLVANIQTGIKIPTQDRQQDYRCKHFKAQIKFNRPSINAQGVCSRLSFLRPQAQRLMLPIGDRLQVWRQTPQWASQCPVIFRPVPVTRFSSESRQIFRQALHNMSPKGSSPPIIKAVFGPMVLSAFQGLSQTAHGELEARPVASNTMTDKPYEESLNRVYLILGQENMGSKLLQAIVAFDAIHR
ncbi:MAG: hypothetical protein VKK59_02480 [Vampirovibrionales bacterium]|nr:hypothetical protein [Vampirovibrionales bacterium]